MRSPCNQILLPTPKIPFLSKAQEIKSPLRKKESQQQLVSLHQKPAYLSFALFSLIHFLLLTFKYLSLKPCPTVLHTYQRAMGPSPILLYELDYRH